MARNEQLERSRRAIDGIDREMLRLLSQRARLSLQVGASKRASGLKIRDSQRERQILKRIRRLNAGPLRDDQLMRIYRAVIRESRKLQRRLDDSVLQSPEQQRGSIRRKENHGD